MQSNTSTSVQSLAYEIIGNFGTFLLGDELWNAYGFKRRPKRGIVFEKFVSRKRLALERFVLEEAFAILFIDFAKAIKDGVPWATYSRKIDLLTHLLYLSIDFKIFKNAGAMQKVVLNSIQYLPMSCNEKFVHYKGRLKSQLGLTTLEMAKHSLRVSRLFIGCDFDNGTFIPNGHLLDLVNKHSAIVDAPFQANADMMAAKTVATMAFDAIT